MSTIGPSAATGKIDIIYSLRISKKTAFHQAQTLAGNRRPKISSRIKNLSSQNHITDLGEKSLKVSDFVQRRHTEAELDGGYFINDV